MRSIISSLILAHRGLIFLSASYDPILQATASTIHCNNNGNASGKQLSANVTAGTSITAKWSQWTHAEGPVMVYMAKCNGACTSTNSASVSWFKIAQTGLISGTLAKGSWGNGQIMSTLSYTATSESALEQSGAIAYTVTQSRARSRPASTSFATSCWRSTRQTPRSSTRSVRTSIPLNNLALELTSVAGAQLIVTGGQGKSPSGSYLIKLPGDYSQNDKGIMVDIYSQAAQTTTTYTPPGPAVWNGQ